MKNKWIIEERQFLSESLRKYEALMTLGNGYLGLRAALEENYENQCRGFYISGTYNRAGLNEVTELPNIADLTAFEIRLNGEKFNLMRGIIHDYKLYLDMKKAELIREVLWESPKNERFKLIFKRFVSLENLHLLSSKIIIQSLDTDICEVKIKSGIDARQNNSGVQHFHEIEKRVYDDEYMQFIQRTTETGIDIYLNSFIRANKTIIKSFSVERRKLLEEIEIKISKDEILELEKISLVYTSLDKEFIHNDVQIKEYSLKKIKELHGLSYDELLNKSIMKWDEFWNKSEIKIKSENEFDNLAVNFSLYHLMIMTPSHDNRFNIGAKGLTGEGYKGHVFWDTEIFLLPFFLYTNPQAAKQLLEYRYNNLNEARKKASSKGYRGALFPWESALDGKEETPEFAAMNIKTGKANRVWSAEKEIHIVADIAYAIIEYFNVTNDTEFMNSKGIEMLLECSKFWVSRAVYDEVRDKYVIKDVIGPDEYTEHIDNNTYTNYLSKYTVIKTIQQLEKIKLENKELYNSLNNKLKIEDEYESFHTFIEKIYLPEENEDGIIPQDDTFLSKKIIDIKKYLSSDLKQGILKDYTRDEVVNMQVLKQSDLVMLFYLLGDEFLKDTVEKNWYYYESKTIHDSSLSMAIHAIVALKFGNSKKAYKCFEKACLIDLGPNMNSSDDGIHAASLGSIWLSVIKGFGGVKERNGVLYINPLLPKEWRELEFTIKFRNKDLSIIISNEKIKISSICDSFLELYVNEKKYSLKNYLEILL
ncbi:MAG: glycoside hydrolase family 65 protein [Sebaldella sp.]|nr:glycoside hydrolase family 65 protein [Sebaldella sp.]